MRVFSLFIFLPFLFFSCKPSVTEKHQVTRSQLQGNWVCETLINWACDNGMYWDTNGYWYCTELIYDAHQPDSMVFINQDLETAHLGLRLSGDSIWLTQGENSDDLLLVYNAEKDMLILDDPTLKQIYRFKKADKELLQYDGQYSTAFKRLMRNCLLTGNYRETGGLNMMSMNNEGSINSWPVYNKYEIFINGDMAGFANEPVMLMGKDSLTDLYLWELNNDTLRMYSPVLKTAPGDKPFYTKGKLRFEFKKETRTTLP